MIVFFRGSGPIAAAIRWQTRGEYAHCGWWARDGNFYEAHAWHGVTRSPSPWTRNRGRADAYALLGVTDEQHEAITAFCFAHVGAGYDWMGCARFLSGVNRNDSNLWFCSELCAEACESAGFPLLHTQAWRLSPVTLSWSPHLRLARRGISKGGVWEI